MIAAAILIAMLGAAWSVAKRFDHVLLTSRFARRCAALTICLWIESAVLFTAWGCVR